MIAWRTCGLAKAGTFSGRPTYVNDELGCSMIWSPYCCLASVYFSGGTVSRMSRLPAWKSA